ncbi:TPA: hypothetical protein I8385_005056 [Citrobacter freundii]|uniref:hypothetical protein n=1 Tax=Enterobacterales TaxID=91347 RepID=UPI0006763E77|nr:MULTISPECIES: hypothetical protein [Enterobacterales]EAA7946119.1 hypothetical protein [Salmonella enterica]EBF6276508.1 hypothetical protein [Salmonella enterica subsp. enterica serovar Cubana]MDV1192639.1 hypothetical protein [Raoultella planticola]HAT2789708.1 hypothetical protein [Citrobacter freundii]EBF6286768.1 hypothetical protein [Salmonella enterica subsp. enterica serovar Cubana]
MVSTTGKNMFSKPMSTFTPERIEQILEFAEGSNPSEAMSLRADEVAVLARIGKAVMSIASVYQCEFCHHDATGQLQWHWEDVNKAFYDKYDPDRRGRRRILYTAPPMPLVSADLLNMASSAIEDLLTNKDRSGAGMWNDIPEQLRRAAELVIDNSRAAEIEAMLMRLYVECDTGERRGNGSQSGVAMPSWQTVEEARVLLGVK